MSLPTDDCRRALAARLRAEDRDDLAEPLEDCGSLMLLTCTHCGSQKEAARHCDRKYCPRCARHLAARRTSRIRNAVAEFRWPLFLTLTIPNSPDPESVRFLRQQFGRLRRRVLWARQVSGGVASIEVTNIGNGWHPHLHSVIDCEWLAIKTPPPRWGEKPGQVADRCARAAAEFGALWSSLVGAPRAQAYIKRTKGSEVVTEVLKYALKAETLLEIDEPLGPLIDVLTKTRLVTTFGTLYGRGRELDDQAARDRPPCETCGESSTLVPPEVLRFYTR